jgi:hypothetical protein
LVKTAGIEINDAGIMGACGDVAAAVSPGYALLAPDKVLVGEAARRVARLEPRRIDNRFWHELDERALSQPAAAGRSRADLAYAQLRQVWDELRQRAGTPVEVAACAVPGTLRPPQLALILGIARACEIPLGGFIDSAVAAASVWSGRGRFVYVDVQLHQAVITAVEVGGEARRERMEVAGRAGLLALQDAWMRLIARLFVTRTRFDPLHQAATEQALFDALPGCLQALAAGDKAEVEIPFGASRHRVTLSREEFLLESQPLYGHIVMGAHRLRRAGHPLTIALSAGAATLPGLADRFAEFKDSEVLACVPGCSALAAAAHAGGWSVARDSASLFRSLPALRGEVAARLAPVKIQSAAPSSRRRAPTHVLYRGKAHALESQPLIVGVAAGPDEGSAAGGRRLRIAGAAAGISPLHCSLLRRNGEAEVVDFSRHGTWLNDEKVVGRAPLHAGDTLRLGTPGATLELIAIDSDSAAPAAGAQA